MPLASSGSIARYRVGKALLRFARYLPQRSSKSVLGRVSGGFKKRFDFRVGQRHVPERVLFRFERPTLQLFDGCFRSGRRDQEQSPVVQLKSFAIDGD